MELDLFKQQFDFITQLAQTYPEAGFFMTGGAVRDALINRPSKDYDFVFTGIEIEDLINSLKKLGEVNLVGKRFGVIKFREFSSKETVDIALPRKEFSLSFSGGYRDFKIQSDHLMPVEEDLARRDLTINAMAYNIISHELIDPFLGERDLKEKIIRTVGSPTLRFQEDYSRMLRAIRFACQLDFNIHPHTQESILKLAPHVQDKLEDNWVVAREVISQEFLKAFDATPVKCLKLLDEFGLLELIFPEIKILQKTNQSPPYHLEGSVWNHTILALEKLNSPKFKKYFNKPVSLLTKIAILFHDVGKPATLTQDDKGIHFAGHDTAGAEITQKICRRLALGASPFFPFSCKSLSWVVRNHLVSIYNQREPVKRIMLEDLFFTNKPAESLLETMLADQLASITEEGLEATDAFMQLYEEIQEMSTSGVLPAAYFTGSEVIEMLDIKPGPDIKHILSDLREKQLNKTILTKVDAKAYLKASRKN